MKSKILLQATVLLLIISGCGKPTNNAKPAGNGTWSATINGVQKSGSGTYVYQRSDNDLSLQLQPSATVYYPNTTLSYGLFTSTPVTTGTYPISLSQASANYASDSSASSIYIANIGQLVITQFNISGQTISGTFYFTGYDSANGDSVVVTNGSFSGPLGVL